MAETPRVNEFESLANWTYLRRAIMERDSYACQRCGQMAPDVFLTVIFKTSVDAGGLPEFENLLTACSACAVGSERLNKGMTKRLKVKEIIPKRVSLLHRLEQLLVANPNGLTANEITEQLKASEDVVRVYLYKLRRVGLAKKIDYRWYHA